MALAPWQHASPCDLVDVTMAVFGKRDRNNFVKGAMAKRGTGLPLGNKGRCSALDGQQEVTPVERLEDDGGVQVAEHIGKGGIGNWSMAGTEDVHSLPLTIPLSCQSKNAQAVEQGEGHVQFHNERSLMATKYIGHLPPILSRECWVACLFQAYLDGFTGIGIIFGNEHRYHALFLS